MQIISFFYLIALGYLSVVTIRTDYKDGMIYNKTLKVFLIGAIVLNLIYYIGFHVELVDSFIGNVFIITCLSLGLFFSNSFAGGDCKLAIVLALLIPAEFYIDINRNKLTLFWAIGFAIFYGYIYLLIISIRDIIKGKNKITLSYVKNSVFTFIKSFLYVVTYIVGINYLVMFLYVKGFIINVWIVRMICICMAWAIDKYPILKKKWLICTIVMIDVLIGLLIKIMPLSLDPGNYIIVFILLVFQMIIRTDLYEEVSVEEIKKGMILSTQSTLWMQNSRVHGLPGISSESLKNRLTEEEVESVKRWAKIREVQYLVVVKKIPFAIFFALGFFSYILLWGILK